MKRAAWQLGLGLALVTAGVLRERGSVPPVQPALLASAPRLRPDYADVTVPPNVAPLNVRVAEPGQRCYARLHGAAGPPLAIRGQGTLLRFPLAAWHALLAANAGGDLTLDVLVRSRDGAWQQFAPVRLHVAREPIDSHLVYRWFRPTYTTDTPLGLYQRDLTSFAQRPLLRSREIGRQCLNCHSFAEQRPDCFAFQTRAPAGGAAMLLVHDGEAHRLETRNEPGQRPAAVSSWHPGGRWLACSRNWIRQYFHEAGSPGRDALDARSALTLVDVQSGQAVDPPALNPAGYLPTFPCWSPDGRWLYYSRARRTWPAGVTMPVAEQPGLRYDLVRTAFDAVHGTWGATETVLAAAALGRSILEAHLSPDGRWLAVCLADYGAFPIFRGQADLALLDLTRRPWQATVVERDRRDTWPTWSSNSRWLLCSSKADNGLFARPYFRYVRPDGQTGKPFALPQADPDVYERSLFTYNLPEFVRGPVTIPTAKLIKAAGQGPGGGRQSGWQSP